MGVKCNGCGHVFKDNEEWKIHAEEKLENGDVRHGGYSVVFESRQVGTIHHDEVGHWEYR